MPPLPIDAEWMKEFLVGLLNTPSPTGFTDQALGYVEDLMSYLQL
jgi:hypothetical protein